MYCPQCGSETVDAAWFCHQCGYALTVTLRGRPARDACDPRARSAEPHVDDEHRTLADELLPIDPKSDQCHCCGRRENLHNWDFGLAKTVSTKRTWTRTAISVAISAVSLPTAGYGVFHPPGKIERLNVLRLRLVLCDDCWQADQASHFTHGGRLQTGLGTLDSLMQTH